MAPAPGSLGSRLRSSIAGALGLLQTRLELLATEFQEEKLRLGSLLGYAAAAFFFLGVGAVMLALFLTVLLWDSHRLLALGVFSALFLGAGIATLLVAVNFARAGSTLFKASLAELARDREALAQGGASAPR